MTQRYNRAVATHYAAYRPPLHQMILGRVLSGEETFRTGLDVGCGTGYSAVALAAYCRRVYGVDPSRSMLGAAVPHEKITYLHGTGEQIPLPDHSVEVVTFAGSLFYAKSEALVKELKRVCRSRAWVVAYDFEILLDGVLQQYGISPQETASAYDHGVNFSGAEGFVEIVAGSEQVGMDVTAPEFAHVLLSDSHRYASLAERYGGPDPHAALASELGAAGAQKVLEANLYFAGYRLDTDR